MTNKYIVKLPLLTKRGEILYLARENETGRTFWSINHATAFSVREIEGVDPRLKPFAERVEE